MQVALRGIDIAIDGFFARQNRGASKVNSLCYCHDSVMTEFAGQPGKPGGNSIKCTQKQSPTNAVEKNESGQAESWNSYLKELVI